MFADPFCCRSHRLLNRSIFTDTICADLALSLGPGAILAAHQAGSIDGIIDRLGELNFFIGDGSGIDIGYISHPLNKIWEKRKTKPPPNDASHYKSILDVIHGEHDTCMYQSSCH